MSSIFIYLFFFISEAFFIFKITGKKCCQYGNQIYYNTNLLVKNEVLVQSCQFRLAGTQIEAGACERPPITL